MKKTAVLILACAPSLAFAVTAPTNVGELAIIFTNLVSGLLGLVTLLTILSFVWGTGLFIRNSGEVKSHEKGKSLLIWGVVGLFLMATIYGILTFFYNDFGFTSGGNASPSSFFLSLPSK